MGTKPKNIKGLAEDAMSKRLNAMLEKRKEYLNSAEDFHVYISKGNSKTGVIKSVSTIPVIDCGKGCKICSKMCYDLRNDCKYREVMNTRARNSALYKIDPKRYFDEISKSCFSELFFRWHVGGDIQDPEYLKGMVRVAEENPHCEFLAFTKSAEIVNDYLDRVGFLPNNLVIVFSNWRGQVLNNPYNLPTSNPMFADGYTTATDGAKLCTGDCTECARLRNGCFSMKKGDQVIFNIH